MVEDLPVDPARAFELLASLTARLASTARLSEIVDTVLEQIVELGFGAVWMAVLDDETGHLATIKEVIDGVDTTHEMPKIFMLDMRQPIGRGFLERRMINIVDPGTLYIIESDDEVIPPGRLALPRVIFEHMQGHPFACGPLVGSRGEPVGALGLSSYRGQQAIPDELLSHGLLRAFMDHLGIAMERALSFSRLEDLNAHLVRAQETIARDARMKAVGELAAAVAHDLNNLSGVALMATSAGMRSPELAFEALPRIERANRAIGDLVARLQRVARPAAAATGPCAVANLRQIAEDTAMMVSSFLEEQSITLDVDLREVPLVHADPVLIQQVALNLILNAKDALMGVAPDLRRLRIETETDGEGARLVVSDRGPGIAPEVLPHLFQPFVTTKREGHAGLGLAAAHASLKHFGGQLAGRNDPRGGAVFVVTLPSAADAGTTDVAAVRPTVTPTRDARILAVDDDPDIVFIISAYLEPLGYRVTTAAGGDQAIAAVAHDRFDLVLCDVGMPRPNGFDVCELLRKSGYRGKLVLMTGWDGERVKADARTAYCDRLIAKPFVGPELVQVVEAVLATERSLGT